MDPQPPTTDDLLVVADELEENGQTVQAEVLREFVEGAAVDLSPGRTVNMRCNGISGQFIIREAELSIDPPAGGWRPGGWTHPAGITATVTLMSDGECTTGPAIGTTVDYAPYPG